MSISVQFIGDDKVIANLRGMSPAVIKAGTASINRSTMKVLRLAKKKAPIGSPARGDKKPGTLRRAINQRVESNGGAVVGIVGIKLSYAAAHEFGFHGTVTVTEHLRMMRVAFGKAVKNPHKITVHAHPMKMNIPERSFLRSSLKELRTEITADLQASVSRAMRGEK